MNNEPQETKKGLIDPVAISTCCGASDPMLEDVMICPDCRDHCDVEYIEEGC